MGKSPAVRAEPVQSAKAAGLRYVSDAMPGIRRIGTGKTFRYLDPNGRSVRDSEVLRRIQSLVIPPAWTDVWICVIAEGHLQAVGRDARKRKQYRYHPRWREVRDETKYHRMLDFGKVLPKIRKQVAHDLKVPGLTRSKVLATIVKLLETTFIRIGNEEYKKQNNSFGLTTLRDRHVNITGQKVQFFFPGKSGVKHAISVDDPRLVRIIRRCRDLPGYQLFQYEDGGKLNTVDSADVNDYLRETAGEDVTAKDFRTWAGTVLAAGVLCQSPFTSARQANRNVKMAIESVAQRLGNTVAVCRKCYVHPTVIQAYLDNALVMDLNPNGKRGGLRSEERAVLEFLQRQAKAKPIPTLTAALTRSIRNVRKAKRK